MVTEFTFSVMIFEKIQQAMRQNSFLVLVLISITMFGIRLSAQPVAWTHWENGDFAEAQQLSLKFLGDNPDHNGAKYLLMKIFYVQGQYAKAIETFLSINRRFLKRNGPAQLAVEAYMHLGKHDEALVLADSYKLYPPAMINMWKQKPFKVHPGETCIVPFTDELFEMNGYRFSSGVWPGIKGSVNGIACDLRLDTGGDYLVMGTAAARRLNIDLMYKTRSVHNITTVKAWFSVADKMSFDGGPEFTNVPVTVLETLGNAVIIGTNILEQFLTTIDYPGRRFVFTPRDNAALKAAHYAMLPEAQTEISFGMWAGHFMIAKGKFSTHQNLNFFFDSGLMYLTEKDGKEVQASFQASKETLFKCGFKGRALAQSNFLFTDLPLEVAGFSQPNTVIWYDKGLKKDRNFEGLRVHGLISHAWLVNYSWTLDFDRMIYTLGIR
jgi:hypothetical protein